MAHDVVLTKTLVETLEQFEPEDAERIINKLEDIDDFPDHFLDRLKSDLLHGLTAVASGHQMTGLPKQDVAVPTRTQREPATSRKTQSSDESARASLSLDTGGGLPFSLI